MTYRLPLTSRSIKACGITNSVPICTSTDYEFIATPVTSKAQLQAIICRKILRHLKVLKGKITPVQKILYPIQRFLQIDNHFIVKGTSIKYLKDPLTLQITNIRVLLCFKIQKKIMIHIHSLTQQPLIVQKQVSKCVKNAEERKNKDVVPKETRKASKQLLIINTDITTYSCSYASEATVVCC